MTAGIQKVTQSGFFFVSPLFRGTTLIIGISSASASSSRICEIYDIPQAFREFILNILILSFFCILCYFQISEDLKINLKLRLKSRLWLTRSGLDAGLRINLKSLIYASIKNFMNVLKIFIDRFCIYWMPSCDFFSDIFFRLQIILNCYLNRITESRQTVADNGHQIIFLIKEPPKK